MTTKPKKPQGRPPIMAGGKPVRVYLDQPTLQRARLLGNGNVSAGIRIAVQSWRPANIA